LTDTWTHENERAIHFRSKATAVGWLFSFNIHYARSEISDLRNRWLHAICACAGWYSKSCISQAFHWDIKYAENWWL